MPDENVAIVIPALDEEAALRQLLPEIPQDFARWVIVADNGSTDATAAVARAAGAIVANEPKRGYGRNCLKGFQMACELGADIVVFMDGDGSDDPVDLPSMLAPVREGHADMVIGSRVSNRTERGAILPQARLGNWLVSRLLRFFYGVRLSDIGSFRVIRCSALEALHMQEMTFGWPVEMVVKAAKAHYRMKELPIHYRRRSHGRSKVAGTVVGSIKAAYYMLRTTLRYIGSAGEEALKKPNNPKKRSDTALVVIARYPEAGKTKTRLARSLGDQATAQLYSTFLTDIAQRFSGQEYDLLWTYTPADVDYDTFIATLAPEFASSMTCFPQQGADLGERLLHAFAWTQKQGYSHAILIGSDSPHISRDAIASARSALNEADVVLGPADDGGYYLIGMHQSHDIFSGIPMSTSAVMQMTVEKAECQGLTVQCITPLFDVDELPDLLRLARLLETDSQLAPATADLLASTRSIYDNNIHR